jgi:hypothetical protein
MSLITGNKVKKTHKLRYCEKEKDKANKRILRSLSFDNNGLVRVPGGRKLLKSSILWTKKCTSETAKHLSVFERKIPLTLEFRFHQE